MDPKRTRQQDLDELKAARKAGMEPFDRMTEDWLLEMIAIENEIAREEAAKIRAIKAPELENPTEI